MRKPAAPGSLKQQDWLAGGTIADGIYEIYGPNYKCIQATDTGNGAKLQQNTYSGLGLQKWRVTAVGTGYYKIINYESNKAMDIPSGTPNTPAPTQNLQLQQWGYLGTNNQLWKIEYLGKWGLYKISSKGNGLVVTLNNNAKIQLEKITQTTFTADSAHVWFFKQA
ncbi:MAG: RICIN domain-containing protein, partial [Mucilaginibacter sp.]